MRQQIPKLELVKQCEYRTRISATYFSQKSFNSLRKKNYLFYLNEKVFFNFCDSLLQKDIKTASKSKITCFLIIYFSSMKYFLSYSVVKKRKCLTNIPDVHFRLDV